jgi:hypothetical protein
MAQTWISVNHTITTSDAQEKLRDEASALSAKIQEFLRNKNMQNLHIHVADDRLIRDCNYHFSYGDEPPIDDQRRQKIGKIIQKSVEDYDELKRIFDAA